jgi:signal transduction histidine kinase
VTVTVEAKTAVIRTSVADNGPGVPEGSVAGLFERFHRAPEQARTEGSGLGLMIVKQIVEAHGGDVGLETKPGEGSTFWFTLPR